jgi:hypothetical protein
MVPDRTGRFQKRPYWEISELEQQCEETIIGFLRERYGFERIPVPTEALTVLIERDAAELDLAMNLSDERYEVFGYTKFERGKKPLVTIARELWEQQHRNNRFADDAHARVWPRPAAHVALRPVCHFERSAALLLAHHASDQRGGGLVRVAGRLRLGLPTDA